VQPISSLLLIIKYLLSGKKRLSNHVTIPSDLRGVLEELLVVLPTMYCKEAAQSPASHPNTFQNCMKNRTVLPVTETQRSHCHPRWPCGRVRPGDNLRPESEFSTSSSDVASESHQPFSLFPVHRTSLISETLHKLAVCCMCMKTVCSIAPSWEVQRATPQVPARESKPLSTFRLEGLVFLSLQTASPEMDANL